MNANIKYLKDENGNIISPVTSVDSIFDSQGGDIKAYLLNAIYPIGSIYISTSSTNPNTLFGFGTWVRWGNGRVPIGVDENNNKFKTVEATGGQFGQYIDSTQLPKHSHNITYTMATGTQAINLTADQCALVSHTHALSKGYFTHVGSGGTNHINEGSTEGFVAAGSVPIQVAGTSQSTSAHNHNLIYTDVSTTSTSFGGADNTPGQYELDTTPCYVTCYMWKRTA